MRAWDRYAELSALLKDDAFGILKELRYVRADDESGAAEADREGRREARDRDGPLRHPDRGVHVDGAHRLGHRPASAAPDDEHRRRARTRARLVISEMVRLVKEWDPYFFEKVGLAPIPNEDVQEGALSRRRAAAATASRRSSTRG